MVARWTMVITQVALMLLFLLMIFENLFIQIFFCFAIINIEFDFVA